MSFKHDYNPSSNAGQDQSISLPRTICIVISALILGGITGILLVGERGPGLEPERVLIPIVAAILAVFTDILIRWHQ